MPDRWRAVALVTIVVVASATAAAGPVGATAPSASAPAVVADDVSPAERVSSRQVRPPQDAVAGMVDVIVLFENDSARARALAAAVIGRVGNGTVTGGTNVTVAPVAFARMPAPAMDALAAHATVRAVERDADVTTTAQTTPWGVDRIDARGAAATVGAANQSQVDVAVIDTGVDPAHPDLNVTWGINTTGTSLTRRTDPSDWADQAGHGTEAAGVVAAVNNTSGVVGVSPAVDLYAIKSLQNLNGGSISDLVEGIDEAMAGPNGVRGDADDADVLSMSLGTPTDSLSLEEAVVNANASGAIIVAAAGNEGNDGDSTDNDVIYPARYDEAIAVAAVTQDDTRAFYSAVGAQVEISAPTNVETTKLGGGYGNFGGTSAATPHVAGAAALAVARSPTADRDVTSAEARTVRATLQDTVEKLDAQSGDRDRFYGYGLVDASQAVRASDGTAGGDVAVVPAGIATASEAGSDPTVVLGNDSSAQSLTVTVRNVSADDRPDNVTLTLPNRSAMDNTTVSVVARDADGDAVPVVNDPASTVRDAGSGTDNRLTVRVSPDRAVDTVDVTVTVSFTAAHAPVDRNRAVSVTAAAVDSEGGDTDDAVATTYTIGASVFDAPVPGGDGVPTDVDGDGRHEDVDGDAAVTFADVVTLFVALESTPVQSTPEAFDFNGNGRIDFIDVIELFESI
jgi:subtilisin